MFRGILKFTCIVGILFIARFASAQKWELGGLVGASNYNGDLAREIVLKETHLAGGLFFRYNLGKFFSLKPAFQMGTISGNDKNFAENKYRNLSFKSRISEFSTVMEYNFKPFGTQVRTESFTPYLALGIAVFHFNPKAKYFDEWHDLHNLRTEGQTGSNTYKLTQLSVPFGMGLKWSVNNNFTVGFEFIYRKTFTDYLDDVSKTYPNLTEHAKTHGALSAALSDRSAEVDGVPEPLSTPGDMRGDPNLKDWYFFSMFSFSYRFTPIICWPNRPSTVWDY
jgi:opacity protein-like surface antigen